MQAFHDGKLAVRFVPNGDKDWIEYSFTDTCKDIIFRPVTDRDVQRFPAQWAAYTAARPSEPINGTALTKLPGITSEMAIGIRLKNVMTVEHLASLDDFAASSIGSNGVTWRDIAKLWLAANRASQPVAASNAQKAPLQKVS